jgi:uncharacterized protein (DUF2164 family)
MSASKKAKRKFDFKSKEHKKAFLGEIISYFQIERGEEIGYVAAEALLEFFMSTVGDEIYKKGVEDAGKILREGLANIELDLSILSD